MHLLRRVDRTVGLLEEGSAFRLDLFLTSRVLSEIKLVP